MLGRRRYRNFLQKSSLKKRKGVFGKLKAAAQFAKDLSGKLKNMKGVIGKFQKIVPPLLEGYKKFNKSKTCESGKIRSLVEKTWGNTKKASEQWS